ncbi:hypothetical protein [Halococcus sp. AFM35]|uniref:hypothetical protein n=1 Tax=Halococcus sp. AFM35 TaxID=3421653 RepID=UPI003EB9A3D5
MQQTTLTDDTTTATSTTDRERSANARTSLAPTDQRGGDGCCPWCLAAAETFEDHGDDRARCGYCDASIPLGADWFERGEKIVV